MSEGKNDKLTKQMLRDMRAQPTSAWQREQLCMIGKEFECLQRHNRCKRSTANKASDHRACQFSTRKKNADNNRSGTRIHRVQKAILAFAKTLIIYLLKDIILDFIRYIFG